MTNIPQEDLDRHPETSEAELDRFLEAAFKSRVQTEQRAGGPPPETIGDYRVLAQVGHGGMGIVLRGHDSRLGRDVALKILKPRYASDPAIVSRFVEEARIGARLQHPGIVPVHQLGTDDRGEPFFTMKLVDGRSLAALLADRASLDAERQKLLDVFLKTCQAVAFAHSRGIVHRDLKPANVMVGSFGEVHLVDWGLAKVLSADELPSPSRSQDESASNLAFKALRLGTPPVSSLAGEVLGTLAYMAPEQARGEGDGVDARADVFSLGGILCEILTGLPPYSGMTRAQVRECAAKAELGPALQRLQLDTVDAQLASIARRCLAADSAARPRDAGELARAMEDWFVALDARARAAELEAVESRTRADQAALRAATERRARRTATALAFVVVLATLGGIATYGTISNERRKRAAGTEAVIVNALQDAAVLRVQALAGAPGALELWTRADASLARAAAAAQAGEAPVLRRDEIVKIREELRAERERAGAIARREAADRKVVADLERAREDFAGHFRVRRLREDTHAALLGYGIDIEALSEEAAAKQIAASPVSRGLIDALSYCGGQGLGGPEPKRRPFQRMLEIAQAAEVDPRRVELRRAILERDEAALIRIASSVEFTTLSASALDDLCGALGVVGAAEPARDCLLRAQTLHPDDFWLCYALTGQVQGTEALGYGRVCVALRPQSAMAWNALGVSLAENARLEAARDAFSKSVDLKPDAAIGHLNLALALGKLGEHAMAVESAIRAVELGAGDPASVQVLLSETVQVEDAELGVRTFRELAGRFGSVPGLHSGLAYWLEMSGDLEDSVAAYKKSIELDPQGAATRLVGMARPLRNLRRFREAADAMRRGHEMGSSQPNWRIPSEEMLAEYEDLGQLETRLEAVLAGTNATDSAEECANLARMCEAKGLHAAEERFYAEQLERDPTLAGEELSNTRRNAARAALQVAAGEGRDATGLAADVTERLRAAALNWMGLELDELSRAIAAGDPGVGTLLLACDAWLGTADMRRLLSEGATQAWSSETRAALRETWARLEELRARAR